MFTAADFNGQHMNGVTWRVGCPSPSLFGNDTTICAGQSIILTPSVTGASYLWQDGSTNLSIDASAGGMYSVEVTEAGCTFEDSILVTIQPAPIVDLGADTILCTGQTLSLDVSATSGTYIWQDGSTASTFSTTSAGSYWVEITNNGCISADTINVSVLNVPTIDLGNDITLCFGESLLLNPTSVQGSYLWQDGSTGPSFSVDQAGIFWLTVSNLCGSSSDTIEISYTPEILFNLGNDTIICAGNTVQLINDIPNSSVIWQDGSVGTSYTVSVSGEYFAQLSFNGCFAHDTILVSVITSPLVDLGPDLIICEGGSALISVNEQNGSINWSTGSSEQSIAVNAEGVYFVEIINLCGTISDSISVSLEDCYCGFYVPNAFTPNSDEFNSGFGPVTDCLISAYELKIYNRWGEVVFESENPDFLWDGTYLGRKVPDGVYSYKITYSSEYTIAETLVGHVTIIR